MLVFTCLGWYLGQQEAIREVTEIARGVREKNPKDPLYMLWLIGLGVTLIGSAIGTTTGIVVRTFVYFGLKRSSARASSEIQSIFSP